ncbi:MAG: hypothetical protein PHQ87_14595, partial [Hydrogenophaga sp.]|uniref:hypothetical protein n=1 Tax=Hydrogenophaga sp. TaxID=1904254 RepID=UPI002607AD7A
PFCRERFMVKLLGVVKKKKKGACSRSHEGATTGCHALAPFPLQGSCQPRRGGYQAVFFTFCGPR